MSSEWEELAELVAKRNSTYQLLSRLYRVEADQALLDTLKSLDFSAEVEDKEIAEGYRLWKRFIASIDESTLQDLAVDYVHSFIGAGRSGRNAAYPYESIYTSQNGLLMQEAYDQVRAVFAKEGITRREDFQEPEDHLALELEFMAILCTRTEQALRASEIQLALQLVRKQKSFLDLHLMNWVPRLCGEVINFSHSDLYRGLAKVTHGFLALDQQVVEDLESGLAASLKPEIAGAVL